ncbi:formamidopyrimidine/5-formyluracil/ 5-hydroxymethyluracil DNA glycosylase [Gracilibacillus halophilus YIM-C55.5]|uniref:Formamidopyrimidine-DNA glycosylase n=1 Tax=Gracilibacillus halophilus YIM-C55.5 TaxID=1308866 RepID=N4WRR5_9BACI|nr:DNA-formamidopyrimidine glycosylase [Gracilibacillus halophilus]ENH97065.1 formamidopyrimidine/5-formyluracil/ 5-hydroxymethyluracil DNA glycosylase [Gracilibacillus halophilus YIM-C55.5]
MPELPEVETIKQTLQHLIQGKTITNVHVHWPKIVQHPDDISEFQTLLKHQTIQQMRRRGKVLLFDLTDVVLVSHLRMEGKYGVFERDEPITPHTHVIFEFDDHTDLRYNDVRKFGTMHVYAKGTEEVNKPLSQLAKDPLEAAFEPDPVVEKIQKSKRAIKNILLDQTVMSGLGNIYVDETLFLAHVHPLTKGCDLSTKQVDDVLKAAITTLQDAVTQGGTTIRSYVNSQGQMGMFQQQLQVYGQDGKPCSNCRSAIEKIKVNGRGTHYCPTCQIQI